PSHVGGSDGRIARCSPVRWRATGEARHDSSVPGLAPCTGTLPDIPRRPADNSPSRIPDAGSAAHSEVTFPSARWKLAGDAGSRPGVATWAAATEGRERGGPQGRRPQVGLEQGPPTGRPA